MVFFLYNFFLNLSCFSKMPYDFCVYIENDNKVKRRTYKLSICILCHGRAIPFYTVRELKKSKNHMHISNETLP